MGWVGMILAFCLTLVAALAPLASAGGFPPNLKFLEGLPVVMNGQCLFDSDGRNVSFGPCEVRAGAAGADGRTFYIMETVAPERLDGVQSFALSAQPVEPPDPFPAKTVVVTWGTCSGRELGLQQAARCEIVVFPDAAKGVRIYLRLMRAGKPAAGELYEVHPQEIIHRKRPPALVPEEGGGQGGTLLIADISVVPDGLAGVPPELSYLARFRRLGTVLCRDIVGSRAGMCQVFLDEETRNHYFLMHWRDRPWRAWRVNGQDRSWKILWSAPPRCEEGDICA